MNMINPLIEKVNTLKDFIDILYPSYKNKTMMKYIKKDKSFKFYTYKEVIDIIKKISLFLKKELKVKKGELVALLSENRPEWGFAYYGILYSGGVVVPIDARFSESEIDYVLSDTEVRYLFVSLSLYEKIADSINYYYKIKKFIVFDGEFIEDSYDNIISLKKLIEKYEDKEIENYKGEENIKPEDWAEVIYTSGTTGTSKGVILSHKNLVFEIKSLQNIVDINSNDKMLSILPLHHTYETTAGFLLPLSKGVEIVYIELITPRVMVDIIKEERITKMVVVPLILQKIYDNIEREINRKFITKLLISSLKYLARFIVKLTNNKIYYIKIFKFLRRKAGLDSIEFFVSGAAPLQEYVAKGMEEYGFVILQGYGLTESSPVLAVNRYLKPEDINKIDNFSVGPAIPGVEIKINNPDENGIGEIIARGDNIMIGYYKKPEETEKVLKDGWLYTGDSGYIDKNGYLYITGRVKNIIVTPGGKNVFPEELEEKLCSSPFILECVVLGIPISKDDKGEYPYAFIVPNFDEIEYHFNKKPNEVTEEFLNKLISEYIKKVNDTLLEYKRIRGFEILYEELPKTSTRKIKRYLLKSRIKYLKDR